MRSAKGSMVAVAMGVLAAASGCSAVSGQKDDVLRVYSGRHYGSEKAFEQFAKETGIDVDFLFGGDAELRERLKTEGKETLADVYLTVDAANLALASGADLLQPLDSPVLEKAIPAQLQDPENRWFSLAVRARPIIYNPKRVDPTELSSYEALSDPKWKRRLCLRNSTSTYTQSLVASLIAHDGYDAALATVAGWVANEPEMINSDPEIVRTVSAGACDVAIVNHYYVAQELAKSPKLAVKVFWPNQDGVGAHVNVSGAGVTKYADDPDLAQQFIEWLATKGQAVLIASSDEYPANDEVAKASEVVAGFGMFKADDLEAAEVGRLNADATRLMDEAKYQ